MTRLAVDRCDIEIEEQRLRQVIPVSSSWLVVDGDVWPLGGERKSHQYTCSGCGERGHTVRTCGRTDEERARRRR